MFATPANLSFLGSNEFSCSHLLERQRDPKCVLLSPIYLWMQLLGKCGVIICTKRGKWAQYLWTWRQIVVPNNVPRDFGPEVAFGTKFQIPVTRQWGREMSAPRPYETDPFHPLSSILCIYQSTSVISSKWYVQVCLGTVGIWQPHMYFAKTLSYYYLLLKALLLRYHFIKNALPVSRFHNQIFKETIQPVSYTHLTLPTTPYV